MYDLLCEYFGSDAVEGVFFLLLLVPIIGWRIAVAFEGKAVPGFWKAHVQSLGRVGISLGICCILFFAYSTQKDEQQQAQQQVVVELFTSISEALGSLGETILRNYLTPEEKKSRLLPVGLATNATAWVAESQCVTSQVREAWQRVPIRRAAFRQTLPFTVSIGGNSYNEVFISSSGVIGFDAPKGSEITREMPYEEAADHVYLALLWGRIDFKPRLGSKMWCGVKDNGNFVASYDTVFIDGDTNAVAKVQVEFIANGDMLLRYSDLPPCSTNAHVAGFQNLDGGWTLPFDNIRSNTAIYLKSFGPLDLTVQDSDTDGDGISDYYELYPTNSISLTDPCNRDSDGDGLMDGEEVSLYATDPGAFSSDASGTGDLWRVLGGLYPSDAPYTNATPSGSLGILTVTTVLEGGTTNGGAVLRIADQYIPVLFGTTLVSRIAVTRDATNLFILARGVNCDNAIAHVTVEASTFTKIRDPSGVFAWSFTLTPSCVTASGAILMPAYTITPEFICFHSPTSKVCRITSTDPDIYFVTTQGMVREYTPPTPDMPTNSFSTETVPIQLASKDTALSTRASVTNIPCHLCNPNGGDSDEYPDGPSFHDWCRFDNGVHIFADGYDATNCPCVTAITNAFECPCSGDGRRPCECAHPVRDPKVMPLNADHTNVLGHAALVIGGTNDLLQVTVPEGTYQPCLLCGCASGVPSSADIYRQTSCIDVSPGMLTADGEFIVAGISPSTNFADTVFMYSLTDYSGAQKVTSYTRKDYTVLGTSVYPADPGHSVSNWFIGCNVTNELTLWTGVKLPSDTGDVTLSVSIDSGTPLPQVYVYNRIAQSNELLVTQGQLTFTQNLGDWRDTYCDTNGYVQAYLLCASGGVARVTHSYETYSGQPHTLSCSSSLLLKAWKISLYPKGLVAFAGSTTNALFTIEPGSWTNCVWTISGNGASFADGPTSAGTMPFYVGTNVWINTGILGAKYTVTCSAVGLPAVSANAGFIVSREIAWTPAGNSVYVWKPINEEAFATSFIDELINTNLYQGWSSSMTNPVTWFFDADPTDDDCETCTLANFKNMANGGIVSLLTHGRTGTIEVVRFASESAANAWKGTESDMHVIPGSNSGTNYWSVLATSEWLVNNWKPSLNQNKAIVLLAVCYSADGYDSIASSVGGETVFAAHGEAEGPLVSEVFSDIIDYMNALSFSTEKGQRVAAKAYAQISAVSRMTIKLFGNGRSTLCPTPQVVFPSTGDEQKAGWGCILFDTYMDSSIPAGTAVVAKTGTIGSRSWGSNGTGSYFIDFLHGGLGTSVEALSDKCRSLGGQQGQPMDGDGIAPMPADGQSKEWSW